MSRWSVRARTTTAAGVVVTLALVVGACVLVVLMRSALQDSIESSAENRAESLAASVERSGPPSSAPQDDELEDVIEQVAATDGRPLWSTTTAGELPVESGSSVRLVDTSEGDDDDLAVYVVSTESADHQGTRYVVSVAVSRDDVDETLGTLVPLLVVGVPVLAVFVTVLTWLLTGRALRPVSAIRSEVEAISASDLTRRVPVPGSRDEIHRLATTMNQMLGRLDESATQQRRFVSDASHELRSPVASLRQAGEVAQTHPAAMPVDELAETVVAESVRMQRLVEQLLALTRADEGVATDAVEIDVDDLVLAEAPRVTSAGLRADVSAVEAARLRGDPGALAQVVRNLTDNAMRHAEQTVAFAVAERGSTIELLVDDDGAGVPESERERVFDRFVRLDEARARDDGGSGLGLAIVREIVARHGGTVRVDEAPLGGARFIVDLPT